MLLIVQLQDKELQEALANSASSTGARSLVLLDGCAMGVWLDWTILLCLWERSCFSIHGRTKMPCRQMLDTNTKHDLISGRVRTRVLLHTDGLLVVLAAHAFYLDVRFTKTSRPFRFSSPSHTWSEHSC